MDSEKKKRTANILRFDEESQMKIDRLITAQIEQGDLNNLEIVVDPANTSFQRGQLNVSKAESERLLSVHW